jgi:hypothetical protein
VYKAGSLRLVSVCAFAFPSKYGKYLTSKLPGLENFTTIDGIALSTTHTFSRSRMFSTTNRKTSIVEETPQYSVGLAFSIKTCATIAFLRSTYTRLAFARSAFAKSTIEPYRTYQESGSTTMCVTVKCYSPVCQHMGFALVSPCAWGATLLTWYMFQYGLKCIGKVITISKDSSYQLEILSHVQIARMLRHELYTNDNEAGARHQI